MDDNNWNSTPGAQAPDPAVPADPAGQPVDSGQGVPTPAPDPADPSPVVDPAVPAWSPPAPATEEPSVPVETPAPEPEAPAAGGTDQSGQV